ncbi:substrate-binding domain-containing protein [Microbacterium karelineae]|uniref:substrate-binding domain-containing protein n=1 Tax=Microbacterium karelineae TaxID=2654283 RepID=UPI0012EAC0E8|nr:substrate-binding domain-containing protein [Microbacterium karelineae]
MKKRILAGLGITAAAVLLAGCSGTGQETTSPDDDGGAGAPSGGDHTYAVVTHAPPGDAFWDRIKSGAEQAGVDYDATIVYNGDPDPALQSQLIDNAVAQEVDGIVVSMANPEGVKTSVEAAVAAGVPVVTINAGMEESAEYGALTHIGQSESVAGAAVGERLSEEGFENVICVIQEAGHVGLEERCSSAGGAFSGEMDNIIVDGRNDAEVKNTLRAKLQSDDSIDGVLTLGGQYAIDAVGAVEESGSAARVATFDLSSDVLTEIEDGRVVFAVDQQPFVQGYVGVTSLYLNTINGNVLGGGQPVYSGPAFVTAENAEAISEFAANGTR